MLSVKSQLSFPPWGKYLFILVQNLFELNVNCLNSLKIGLEQREREREREKERERKRERERERERAENPVRPEII